MKMIAYALLFLGMHASATFATDSKTSGAAAACSVSAPSAKQPTPKSDWKIGEPANLEKYRCQPIQMTKIVCVTEIRENCASTEQYSGCEQRTGVGVTAIAADICMLNTATGPIQQSYTVNLISEAGMNLCGKRRYEVTCYK